MSTTRRTRKLIQEGGGTIDWLPDWPPIHKDANAFPMMNDDSLAGLRASIRENGQQEKIFMTPEGELVEGRNRYLACKLEGIEPKLVAVEENGTPWKERIRMWNLTRRHLTASQRAANIRLSNAKLTQEQVAVKAGCSQPQVARVDTGAEFAAAEGTAKTLSAAYSMIAYGQITEGELRRRKQTQEKKRKLTAADKLQADRIDRAGQALQKMIDAVPAKDKVAFADGMRAAAGIVIAHNIDAHDLEQIVAWATHEDLDDDEIEG